MLFSFITLSIGFVFPLLVFEGILRVLPVRDAMTSLSVNKENPIFRFQPKKSFFWSKDWNFSIQMIKYSNNYGFLNHRDYTADGNSPLLAVIGDSYVEASQVSNDDPSWFAF